MDADLTSTEKTSLWRMRHRLPSTIAAFVAICHRIVLPGRVTALQAWEATPKADPPRPRNQLRPVGWDGIRRTTVAKNGIVQVRQTRFHVTWLLAYQTVFLVETDQHLLVFDDQGTELMKYRWPRPGIKYVGEDGNPGPSDCHRCPDAVLSPMP